jgi:uncharacterized membrane protein HdeD (DUF308 family)
MNSALLVFHAVLITSLTTSFLIHNTLIESETLLTLYIINALIAAGIYNVAYCFRKTQQDYLGYYFLAGTLIKFVAFFIYVLPKFKEDGEQTTEEFFSFFLPYIVALLVETTLKIN